MWIINGTPTRPYAHRMLECGRRVHASGLREDLMVRVLGQWNHWWERTMEQYREEST